jgi:hypothetical protein
MVTSVKFGLRFHRIAFCERHRRSTTVVTKTLMGGKTKECSLEQRADLANATIVSRFVKKGG